jgi:redox-sensitive bicupin YhaK (pirin superfamily)
VSGPVTGGDDAPVRAIGAPAAPSLELSNSRDQQVGNVGVRRALPRRGRRTVGAWCFADHMGPADVTERSGLDIGAHPHIGLQTVTWLVDGQVLHRDSLGTEQVIAPGQLNLMTAGHGVSHSEEATGRYRGNLEGVQLWIAQPGSTRDGAPAFEHHAALPQVEFDRAVATVLVGDLAEQASPARRDSPLVGADPRPAAGGDGAAAARGVGARGRGPARRRRRGRSRRRAGTTGLPRPGPRQLVLDALAPSRAVLLGGEPLEEELVMWWNFVGRSRDEISTAYEAWQQQSPRFGRVASALPRIPAPPPGWARGTQRHR